MVNALELEIITFVNAVTELDIIVWIMFNVWIMFFVRNL